MKTIIYIIIFSILSLNVCAQKTCSNTVSSSNGSNAVTLQKCFTTADSPVQTGVPITFELTFSVTGNVTNLNIADIIPGNMEFVSELSPNWLNWNGSNANPEWTATNPPNGSYSISLSLRFKRGTTCNGEQAFNYATIKADGINEASTAPDTIPVTAISADGWKIRKEARDNQVLTGSTVTYDIYVYNSLGVNGSHNLNNVSITDLLPPGAILISQNCNFPVLDVTATNSGNSVSTPYRCQVVVEYPDPPFVSGDCPENTVRLSGVNPCRDQFFTTGRERICVYDTIPVSNATSLTKSVFMDNRVPGCLGTYSIHFQNNGNTAVSDYILSDIFPSDIDVSRIEITHSNGTPFTYSAPGGSPSTGTYNSNTALIINGSPTSINIQPSSLPANGSFYIRVYFKLKNTVSSGQVITNTARLTSASTSTNLDDSASLTVENLAPKLKVRKEICPPSNSTYRPGDVFTYRIRFQNYGNLDYSGGTLEDVLDNRLEYLGNVKVYKTSAGSPSNPPCSGSATAAPGTTDIISSTNINYDLTNNKLTIGLPNIPQDCDSFYYSGNSTVNALETFVVEFDVKVKDGTPPGQIHNKARIYDSFNSFESNRKTISINSIFELKAEKFISTDGGTTYTQNVTSVAAGSNVKYKLVLTNSGNMILTNIRLVDVLPNIGDKNVQLCFPRGSTVNSSLVGPANLSTNLTANYSTVLNPDVTLEFGSTCIGSTIPSWTSSFSGAKSIKVKSIPSFNLPPLSSETIVFDVQIPANATSSDKFCNDFSIKAESVSGTPTQLFSSNQVCTDITEIPVTDCCPEEKTFEFELKKTGGPHNRNPGEGWSGNEPLSWIENKITVGNPNNVNIPVTQIRVSIVDMQFEDNIQACGDCIENPANWASLSHEGIPGTDTGKPIVSGLSGQLDAVTTINDGSDLPPATWYTFNKNYNTKELVWENPNGVLLTGGEELEFETFLPPFSEIPCCVKNVKICYKVTYRFADCTQCDRIICTRGDDLAEDIENKDELKLLAENKGCCERVLSLNTDANASYDWSTGEKTKQITVAYNGTYSVTISTGISSVTKNIVVSDIPKGAFPILTHPTRIYPNSSLGPDKLYISNHNLSANAPNAYNASKYRLWIFDRWGKIIREYEEESCNGFKNFSISWDGKDAYGNYVKTDTYEWRFFVQNCSFEDYKQIKFNTIENYCKKRVFGICVKKGRRVVNKLLTVGEVTVVR